MGNTYGLAHTLNWMEARKNVHQEDKRMIKAMIEKNKFRDVLVTGYM